MRTPRVSCLRAPASAAEVTRARAVVDDERPSKTEIERAEVLDEVNAIIDRAFAQLRATPAPTLLEVRTVGRAALPATVIGLLFHAAEHSTRHVGQAITTALILGGA